MALAIAAGHAARGGPEIKPDLCPEGGKPRTILKMLDPNELQVYESLSTEYPTDPVHDFIPRFEGVVEEIADDGDSDDKGVVSRFIRISNLLHDYEDPKVMDIKIGVRTFLESECSNQKLRPDLYEKMRKMYPSELTPAEHQAGAITKHRWMTTRDATSTISSLGYRIDGIAGYRRKNRKEVEEEIGQFRTRGDTLEAFIAFCDVAATDDGVYPGIQGTTLSIAEKMAAKLRGLRDAASRSPFISGHELIGTSILIVADANGTVGVYWIDFAKTLPVADGVQITHDSPWEQGNHEDGVITGLDNMIETFEKAIEDLQDPKQDIGARSFTLSVNDYREPVQPQCCGFIRPRRTSRRKVELRDPIERRSDVNILSMIPSFAGTVADEEGNVWKSGYALAKKGAAAVMTHMSTMRSGFSRQTSAVAVKTADRLRKSFTWGSNSCDSLPKDFLPASSEVGHNSHRRPSGATNHGSSRDDLTSFKSSKTSLTWGAETVVSFPAGSEGNSTYEATLLQEPRIRFDSKGSEAIEELSETIVSI